MIRDNILVFDIETIPDIEAGRKLYSLPDSLSEDEVAKVMQTKRLEKANTTFLPHYLQKIVVISIVLATPNKIKIFSLSEENDTESEILKRFFRGIKDFSPILVSWNGTGFDLPVIHYRGLLHNISAPSYWETGENNKDYKFNNYISRYHMRHLDVMDVLGLYTGRANAPLDELSQMLGFPGKQVLHGSEVWHAYQEGKVVEIRKYCEIDVLNTYLVFLRFELFRGKLNDNEYSKEIERVKEYLKEANPDEAEHLHDFLNSWT